MNLRPLTEPKVISALLTPQPGKEAELAQTLDSLAREIRTQEDCLECAIGREWTEGSRFLLFMVWRDLASLEAHLASETFRILLGATSVLTSPLGFRFISAQGGYLPAAEPPGSRRSRTRTATGPL